MANAIDVPIALLGYGTVGSAVDRHLVMHGAALERATGLRLHVVHALVRDVDKRRAHPAPPGVLTTDFDTIEHDDDIAAVAEVLVGVSPAGEYIERLLARGTQVATANKQLLARDDRGLLGRVGAEGSVCGAIPVLRMLRDGLPPGGCSRVSGIVNGTTNYLLSRMELGATMSEALRDAQQLGYAEQDPTSDLCGVDAAAKMAIIATVAFGETVSIDDVDFEGIEDVRSSDVRAARDRGQVVRLVGSATPERVEVRVTTLDASHQFAAARGADNAVRIEGPGFRELTLVGPGAGGAETATAVVADLVSLVRSTLLRQDQGPRAVLRESGPHLVGSDTSRRQS